ncbi:VPLPA-CTERM sorting domain-containing protein [uncultured Rhodospira sp.]|uniref:VPLPA-CTERM sorting domain-containing protein n=1 Tax=uncultured Rhodospira sp. TaxID=1936189 RepID=UPI0026225B10|nr:VPLPA-CTERM sorting domain-containing protein [uncultured Rhodospira sp.]
MAAGTAHASLIQNGSFETGPTGGQSATGLYGLTYSELLDGSVGSDGNKGWDVYAGIDHWSSNQGTGIEVQTEGAIGFTPKDGDYYIELDSEDVTGSDANSNAYQTAISLAANTLYNLTYWFTWREDSSAADNQITVTLSDGGGAVETWDPNTQYDETGTIPDWQFISHAFSVDAAGDYTLAFAATPVGSGNEFGGFIDDVALNAVPLPAAAWFMLTALGGLIGTRWLKKGQAA